MAGFVYFWLVVVRQWIDGDAIRLSMPFRSGKQALAEDTGVEPATEHDTTSVFAIVHSSDQELAAAGQRKVDVSSLHLASDDAAQLHPSLIAILWRNADDDVKRHVFEILKSQVQSL